MRLEEKKKITEIIGRQKITGMTISICESNKQPRALITTWKTKTLQEDTTILLLVKDFEKVTEFINCELDFAILPADWSISYNSRY